MPRRGALRVATCQFLVSGDVRRNGRLVRRQMIEARRRRADLAHFPECALSGYPGVDRKSLADLDWTALEQETRAICALAAELKLGVVLGSSHRLSGSHKPHNCLYLIDPRGRIRDRYDKRFCTGSDLKHYLPGDHFVTFMANGVKCGLLICYDLRFPELYREYKKLGIQLMLHSFHNAHGRKRGIWADIMVPTLKGHAGINYMWVSANNSSAYYQQWPSVLIQPDGVIAARLVQHRGGVTVNTVDTRRKLYDASKVWRGRAMRGVLHSGRLVRDPRSRNRRAL